MNDWGIILLFQVIKKTVLKLANALDFKGP